LNHATAAATLNRYSQHRDRDVTFQPQQQQQQQQQPQLRYSFGNEYIYGDTQLGGMGSSFEPMLSSTTIHNPNTLDGIIGPSAAATFIHGKKAFGLFQLLILRLYAYVKYKTLQY
jgi:transcription initiation factor TFIID subunit TAF12